MKEVDPRQAENVEGGPEKEIVKEDAEETDQGKFNKILMQDLDLTMLKPKVAHYDVVLQRCCHLFQNTRPCGKSTTW